MDMGSIVFDSNVEGRGDWGVGGAPKRSLEHRSKKIDHHDFSDALFTCGRWDRVARKQYQAHKCFK